MTAPSAHSSDWRAFVGPPARRDTDPTFWNWASALMLDAAYDPETAIPPTTLAASLDVDSDSTVQFTSSSLWPTAGGAWIGAGNGAGEIPAHIEYTGLSSGTATLAIAEAVSNEYPGTHTIGGGVVPYAKFWWPITTDDGVFNLREYAENQYTAVNWRASCRGLLAPIVALRHRYLFLLQRRLYNYTTGAYGNWTNALIGWIDSVKVNDNADDEERWNIEIVSSMGVYGAIKVDGVKVGNTQIQQGATVTASSTLANAYKGYNLQEFDGSAPTLTPANVVDGRVKPAWMSERYIGQDNDYADWSDETFDGILDVAKVVISQVHVSKYPGQGPGYRWIELTVLDDSGLGEVYIAYSKTATNGVGTYVTDYYFHFDMSSYATGDRIIIAEVASLFQGENPDHDAAAVIDGASLSYRVGIPEQYLLDVQGATTGSFKITDGSTDSGDINYDATAAQVASAISAIDIDIEVHGNGGPLPDTNVVIAFAVDDTDRPYGTASGYAVHGTMSIDVTPTWTQIVNGNDAWFAGSDADTVEAWFNLLDLNEGGLSVRPETLEAWNTVRWGSITMQPGLGDDTLWTGSNVAAITDPETLRLHYDPDTTLGGTASEPADYWQSSEIHTPGYNANGAEWVLMQLPGMNLSLAADVGTSATSLSIQDAAGAASVNGLPDTGTVQVGAKQYAYTTIDRDTGTLSGLITTAVHKEGDPVRIVIGGIATDAYPVSSIKIKRDPDVPEVEDMIIYHSSYMVVRDGDETNFHLDYTQVAITAESGTNYSTATEAGLYVGTLDLSASNPRVKWIMIRGTKMATIPYRFAINEVTVDYDNSVFNSGDFLEDVTIGESMVQLLDNAGFPSAAITNTATTDVDSYTTEPGRVWPILLDMADFGGKQIIVGRDSKLSISNNTLLTPGSSDMDSELPATVGTLSRDNTQYHEFDWLSSSDVGQVELRWRSPDGLTEGTERYPATANPFGETEGIGPFIHADATAAQNAAKRHYFQLKRPRNALWEIAGDGFGHRPLSFYDGTWDWTQRTIERVYMSESADHVLQDGECSTVVGTMQVSREDTR